MNVEIKGRSVIGMVANFGVFGMNSVMAGLGVVGIEVTARLVVVDSVEVGVGIDV